MPDLNDIDSSETVRIAGAGPSSGVATNWMQVDAFGSAQTGLYNAAGSIAAFGAGTTSSIVLRVVLPTDQTAIPSTQSGTWNITNITGTISLPTGAATAANQATQITSLQLIDNIIGPVTPGTVATGSALIGGQFNTTLPTLTNTQQSALQLDSSGRLIIAPLTNTSIVKAQLQDNSGNGIASKNSQLETTDTINTSFVAGIIAVSTTPVQVKVGGSVLANRKYARVQPLNGVVYQGASNSITSTAGSGNIMRNQIEVKAFTDNVANWFLVAATGTVNVYIEEGS